MSPYLAAAITLAVCAVLFFASRYIKTPAIVAKVEANVEDDALKLVMRSLEALADNSADTQAIDRATANIQLRSQRISALKAKVQTLA